MANAAATEPSAEERSVSSEEERYVVFGLYNGQEKESNYRYMPFDGYEEDIAFLKEMIDDAAFAYAAEGPDFRFSLDTTHFVSRQTAEEHSEVRGLGGFTSDFAFWGGPMDFSDIWKCWNEEGGKRSRKYKDFAMMLFDGTKE